MKFENVEGFRFVAARLPLVGRFATVFGFGAVIIHLPRKHPQRCPDCSGHWVRLHERR